MEASPHTPPNSLNAPNPELVGIVESRLVSNVFALTFKEARLATTGVQS